MTANIFNILSNIVAPEKPDFPVAKAPDVRIDEKRDAFRKELGQAEKFARQDAPKLERRQEPQPRDRVAEYDRPSSREESYRTERSDRAENTAPRKEVSTTKNTPRPQEEAAVTDTTENTPDTPDTTDTLKDIIVALRNLLKGDASEEDLLNIAQTLFPNLTEGETKKVARAIQAGINEDTISQKTKDLLPASVNLAQFEKAVANIKALVTTAENNVLELTPEDVTALIEKVRPSQTVKYDPTVATTDKAEDKKDAPATRETRLKSIAEIKLAAQNRETAVLNAVVDTNITASKIDPQALNALLATQKAPQIEIPVDAPEELAISFEPLANKGSAKTRKSAGLKGGVKDLDAALKQNDLSGKVKVTPEQGLQKVARQVGNKLAASTALAAQTANNKAGKIEVVTQTVSNEVGVPQAVTNRGAQISEVVKESSLYGSRAPIAAKQVAIQINKAVKNGTDRIRVQLKPMELGQVDVELTLTKDSVKAVVHVERPETLHLLQRDAGTLQKALESAGLNVDTGGLQFNMRGDGQQHAGYNGSYNSNTSAGGNTAENSSNHATDVIAAQTAHTISTYTGKGALDIQV